jgi:hypothetical protein
VLYRLLIDFIESIESAIRLARFHATAEAWNRTVRADCIRRQK